MPSKTPAVFLDRDGTLIHDVGYVSDPRTVCLIPGAVEALANLQGQGFRLIVVSNQSGIGRGLITPDQASQVHEELGAQLAKFNLQLDAAYYCPHGPDDSCTCRKPAPGLLLRAAEEMGIDPSQSFMVGDKPSDIEAGHAAGCKTIFFDAERKAEIPPLADFVAAGWSEATQYILSASVKMCLPRT